jgi:hypothetical protein
VGATADEESGGEEAAGERATEEAGEKDMRHWIAVAALLSLAGCATAVNGFDERIGFDSAPQGAAVRVTRIDLAGERLDLEGRCDTPCSLVLERGPTYNVRFSKDGCGPVNIRLYPRVDSAYYYFWIPDLWTGGAYDIQPNPVNVTMTCGMTTSASS